LLRSDQVDRRVTSSPRVTVCVPNFNYGHFVGAAIESCLAQSYPHVEVVVVDDGSTDGSREVLSSYADVATVIFQSHKGAWQTYGRAFSESAGDIVIFLDADDLLVPDVVERVVQAFAEMPARVARAVAPSGRRHGWEPDRCDVPADALGDAGRGPS